MTPPSRRHLAPLLFLFFGSGCSALIYEIVWLQLLQLVIGSAAVSLGVLLATFMGGMCAGSLAAPRFLPASMHPLRLYAVLEFGIGALGIAVLLGMPYVDRLYVASVGHGLPAILLRGAIAALCLLPPAALMGATLPAIARWIESTPQGVAWLGFFYGGNIGGAVFGCLLAGFYLLRIHDMATATYVAAGINFAVALLALGLAARAGQPAAPPEAAFIARPPNGWPVYVTIALSGACALGAEVIWTRLLSLILGATVYTFSIILAVFLLGLGLGSGGGSLLARSIARPRLALGCCQLLLAAAIAWTAFMLANSLPYWPISPGLSRSPWFTFQLDLVRCLWAILPPTLLWGASFPLALAAAAGAQEPERLVGRMYAANTAGAIAGAVAASLVLIPWIGTQQAQRLLIGLSAAAALLALAPLLRPIRIATSSALAASIAFAAWMIWSVPPLPWALVAHGRKLVSTIGPSTVIYVGEGMNASVAVSRLERVRMFHVSGKVEASSQPEDMRVQRMLGHLPALVHGNPRSALVVGFGAGVTAGSFVLHPDTTRLVICEIEKLIPDVSARYFGAENNHVMRDPRTQVVYDDARHFVLTTRETFDVITSDPIHPWVKGTAPLYTKEYYELCRRHLNPGGVIAQWLPLYESDLKTVQSAIATFFDVFPNGTLWTNDIAGEGYDVVLLGHAASAQIDIDELQRRLDRSDHSRVLKSLREVELGSALDLLATYAGQSSDLRHWLRNSEINHDRNLRLQYLAGMGVNSVRSQFIHDQLLDRRSFPEGLLVGSAARVQALRQAMGIRP